MTFKFGTNDRKDSPRKDRGTQANLQVNMGQQRVRTLGVVGSGPGEVGDLQRGQIT